MKTQKRRRRKGKTNYFKRIKLLKSNTPRVVFRRTNRYVISQYITSEEARDKVEIGTSSKELLKYGWPKEARGSLKSIPASYLLGLLMGKKILERKFKTPIIDFGLHKAIHKSRLYSFVKGLIDAGVDIPHKEKIFPSKERIEGRHIKGIPFQEIKSKINNKPFEKVSKQEH